MPPRAMAIGELRDAVGEELGVSGWLDVDQRRIDAFADVSGDRQWIHVDPARAADGPYGATVAHGLLVLSLLPALAAEVLEPVGASARVNYGYDRVRFPAPVPAGVAIRNRLTLLACDLRDDGGAMLALEHHVEARGLTRPVCVAEARTLLVGVRG